MNAKIQCPECGRKFSKHLIAFPMFSDDKPETMVYFICPLCVADIRSKGKEARDKTKLFKYDHSRKLYEEAVAENKKNKQVKNAKLKNGIKFIKLVKLNSEEKQLVKRSIKK